MSDLPIRNSSTPSSPVVTKGIDDEDSNNIISTNAGDDNNNKTGSVQNKVETTKPTTTQAQGPGLPLVSTPARDPVEIAAKRMQNLRLHHNPNFTSSPIIPFAAGSPMRNFNAGTPNRQYDLTPVMNNVSSTAPPMGVDLDLDLELDFDLDMLDARNGDDATGGNPFAPRRLQPNSSSDRMLPPLAQRGLLPVRPKPHLPEPMPLIPVSSEPVLPPIRAPELAFLPPNVEDPIPLPLAGKAGYSFTSRTQYEQQRQQPEPVSPTTCHLPPYQPSRQDSDLNLGIPPEELNRIFMSRPIESNSSNWSDDVDEDESIEDNLLLSQAIPLEERQWSIPSIRMANELRGSITGSVSTNTYYTDEDDESSLLYREDDASLSSYDGSYAHATGADAVPTVFVVPPPTGMEGAQQQQQQQQQQQGEAMDYSVDAQAHRDRRRSQKKKQQRDLKALEWLRALKAGENEVAEAASSKFLTRSQNNSLSITSSAVYDKPQQKRLSAVVTSTFLLEDDDDSLCCDMNKAKPLFN